MPHLSGYEIGDRIILGRYDHRNKICENLIGITGTVIDYCKLGDIGKYKEYAVARCDSFTGISLRGESDNMICVKNGDNSILLERKPIISIEDLI